MATATPLLDPVADEEFGAHSDVGDNDYDGAVPPISKTTLFLLNFILFIQWVLMSMISSFFPDSFIGDQISDTMQGVLFASLPVGAMVTAPFIGRIMLRLKPKNTIMIGVVAMAVFMLAFGSVVFFITTADAFYPFVVFGFLYGSLSTLAEMGCYAMLTQIGSERGNVGLMISIAEVVTGFGCMLGPPIGGALFQLGSSLSETMQFFLPFAIIVVIPICTFVAVAFLLPKRPIDPDKKPGRFQLCKPTARWRLGVVCVGIVVTACTYASLSPTLEIRVDYLGVPASSLSSTTGIYFFLGSSLYMAGALPIGRLLDKGCCTRPVNRSGDTDKGEEVSTTIAIAESANKLVAKENATPESLANEDKEQLEAEQLYTKTCCLGIEPESPVAPMVLMGIGSILNVLACVLIGPFKLGPVALDSFDSLGWVIVALLVQGSASCLIVIPSMPALLLGVGKNDELGQARVTGVWGACYAMGTSLGPFLGDVLMELKVPFFCRHGDWPTNSTVVTTEAADFTGSNSSHHHKQHCFDGTMSILGSVGILYCLVFFAYCTAEYCRHKTFR